MQCLREVKIKLIWESWDNKLMQITVNFTFNRKLQEAVTTSCTQDVSNDPCTILSNSFKMFIDSKATIIAHIRFLINLF